MVAAAAVQVLAVVLLVGFAIRKCGSKEEEPPKRSFTRVSDEEVGARPQPRLTGLAFTCGRPCVRRPRRI